MQMNQRSEKMGVLYEYTLVQCQRKNVKGWLLEYQKESSQHSETLGFFPTRKEANKALMDHHFKIEQKNLGEHNDKT
jgi:hypothetical protein